MMRPKEQSATGAWRRRSQWISGGTREEAERGGGENQGRQPRNVGGVDKNEGHCAALLENKGA